MIWNCVVSEKIFLKPRQIDNNKTKIVSKPLNLNNCDQLNLSSMLN